MRYANYVLFILTVLFSTLSTNKLYADLNNNQVINHRIIKRIEELKTINGYSSDDFNACQITWSTRELKKPDPLSQFTPHEITFLYENNEIIKLVNSRVGDKESIRGLGLNCLEFNNYVYLFFDTLSYETRYKFNLADLSYVIYSSDKGITWSALQSLHQFSVKAKFVLPHDHFLKYVKLFGNRKNHALSIFNLRDETTYLFSPTFDILKAVPVYNRLTNFHDPKDFYYYKNLLYLVRGSCEKIKGRFQCPGHTYIETSRDFGITWEKNIFPLIKKSHLLTLNNTLHHFYFEPCSTNWINPIPGWNRSNVCGYIKARKLNILGQWEKPMVLMKTADQLLDIYHADKPILVWKDLRFHKSRACGFIPLIGCVDSKPFKGPNVTYAGELNVDNWQIDESIIEYIN